MRRAQQNLADFVSLIDWKNFNRKNLNEEILVSNPDFAVFGCGDEEQAIVWLLHGWKNKENRSKKQKPDNRFTVSVPNLRSGRYRVYLWNTVLGEADLLEIFKGNEDLTFTFQSETKNIALAIISVME